MRLVIIHRVGGIWIYEVDADEVFLYGCAIEKNQHWFISNTLLFCTVEAAREDYGVKVPARRAK